MLLETRGPGAIARVMYDYLKPDSSSYAYSHTFEEWCEWWDEQVAILRESMTEDVADGN